MTSRTASTALPASFLPKSDRLATWSTNSDFVTFGLLLDEVVVGRRYQRLRIARPVNPLANGDSPPARPPKRGSCAERRPGTAAQCGAPTGRPGVRNRRTPGPAR